MCSRRNYIASQNCNKARTMRGGPFQGGSSSSSSSSSPSPSPTRVKRCIEKECVASCALRHISQEGIQSVTISYLAVMLNRSVGAECRGVLRPAREGHGQPGEAGRWYSQSGACVLGPAAVAG